MPSATYRPLVARYRLERRLGLGGLGVVFEAVDPELSRRVAVKLLRRGRADKVSLQRLRREAAALARVSHPAVVSVFDVGEYEAPRDAEWPVDVPLRGVYIVMELVEGIDLQKWLQTPRPAAEVLRVFLGAGRGLAAAHAAGVVHRDFKPSNVIVGQDGIVKVLDFGLARWGASVGTETATSEDALETSGDPEPSMTATGVVMGTPAYMAPEQHRGRTIDARTDQYAFCVALAEALCGRRPFEGTTVAELAAAKDRGVLHPRTKGIPVKLRAPIERGLATDPAERFASMDALLAALQPRASRFAWWIGLSFVGGLGVAGLVAGPEEPKVEHEIAVAGAGDDEDVAIPSVAAEVLRRDAELAWVASDSAALDELLEAAAPGGALPEGDPSLAAEVLLWRGHKAAEGEGAALYEQAFFLAEASALPSTAARAAAAMSTIATGDHGGAMAEWTRHAWLHLHRGPWDRAAAIDVAVGQAYTLAIAMPGDEAREALDTATAIIGDVESGDGPWIAHRIVNLAAAWRYVDEPDIALHWAERARRLIEATGDTDHVVRAQADEQIGLALWRMDRCDEALPYLQSAQASFLVRGKGEIGLSAALLGQQVAECLRALGRKDAAIEEYRRTLPYWEGLPTEYGQRLLKARIAIARMLVEQGRRDDAEAEYERAVSVVHPHGFDPPMRETARRELQALREGHRPARSSVGP